MTANRDTTLGYYYTGIGEVGNWVYISYSTGRCTGNGEVVYGFRDI